MRSLFVIAIVLYLATCLKAAEPVDEKPACQGQILECIEEKRNELKRRGALDIFLHVPHSLQAPDHEHAGQDHSPDDWFIRALPPVPGAGEKAGLRVGDTVLMWNGKDMPENMETLKKLLADVKVGEKIKFTIERNGEVAEIMVEAESPEPWQVESWLTQFILDSYGPVVHTAYRQRTQSSQ